MLAPDSYGNLALPAWDVVVSVGWFDLFASEKQILGLVEPNPNLETFTLWSIHKALHSLPHLKFYNKFIIFEGVLKNIIYFALQYAIDGNVNHVCTTEIYVITWEDFYILHSLHEKWGILTKMNDSFYEDFYQVCWNETFLVRILVENLVEIRHFCNSACNKLHFFREGRIVCLLFTFMRYF